MTRSSDAAERCRNTPKIRRYVVTHIGKYGLRTLALPAQGRYTYETREEAQTMIDAMMANNPRETLEKLYGLPLEVRNCECWPVHFDPVGIYPEEG